jgi:putative transposase
VNARRQYASIAFNEHCKDVGVHTSMGRIGDAYDNAIAESFFATLECELIDHRSFRTKAEARLALFTWIEGWYNLRRRHSAIGHFSPIKFERRPPQSDSTAAKRHKCSLKTLRENAVIQRQLQVVLQFFRAA